MIRFFEIDNPYYALIKAKNPVDAKRIYNEIVADLDDLDEVKEVSEVYALAKFSQAPGENRELIDVGTVVKEFYDPNTKVLIMDGSLI